MCNLLRFDTNRSCFWLMWDEWVQVAGQLSLEASLQWDAEPCASPRTGRIWSDASPRAARIFWRLARGDWLTERDWSRHTDLTRTRPGFHWVSRSCLTRCGSLNVIIRKFEGGNENALETDAFRSTWRRLRDAVMWDVMFREVIFTRFFVDVIFQMLFSEVRFIVC